MKREGTASEERVEGIKRNVFYIKAFIYIFIYII